LIYENKERNKDKIVPLVTIRTSGALGANWVQAHWCKETCWLPWDWETWQEYWWWVSTLLTASCLGSVNDGVGRGGKGR